VHFEPEPRRVVQRGPQRGVADEDAGLGLAHHQGEIGRAAVVVGLDAVLLGEQQLREPHRGARGGAEGDPLAVQGLQRGLGDDHAGHHGTVAADRDVGQGDEFVRVPEELHQRDRRDVEIPVDEPGAEPLRGVLEELQVEQGAGAGEAPVEGQAVEELDVADARPAARSRGWMCCHRSEASPPEVARSFGGSPACDLFLFPGRKARATLAASCSLVTLAVQSLRSL
jgi:hypothetical protein